jgi:hypothetical protein
MQRAARFDVGRSRVNEKFVTRSTGKRVKLEGFAFSDGGDSLTLRRLSDDVRLIEVAPRNADRVVHR